MAIKRSFSVKNLKHCNRLKSRAQILFENLKNKINAGKQQKRDFLELLRENETLKSQLSTANSKITELNLEAKGWQQAAEGLARMIEEIRAKEEAGNV